MTEQMLKVVFETANAKAGKDGWIELPEGRLMTLHVARSGVPLTVGKVAAVHLANGIIQARTAKRETFVLAADDIFAAAVDATTETAAARKTGFLG